MEKKQTIRKEIKKILDEKPVTETVKKYIDYTNNLRSKGILKEDTFDLREVHKSRGRSLVFDKPKRDSLLGLP